MQERKHAIVRLKLAFSPKERLGKIGKKKRIKQRAILTICSKNSVKLIAKKCLLPQSELRKIAYIAEKISEGRANNIIEVVCLSRLKKSRQLGNKNKIMLIAMLITKVIISPAETVEYASFDLLFAQL